MIFHVVKHRYFVIVCVEISTGAPWIIIYIPNISWQHVLYTSDISCTKTISGSKDSGKTIGMVRTFNQNT